MASIFTWEQDTPKVASPWLQASSEYDESAVPLPTSGELASLETPPSTEANTPRKSSRVSRLQAEPQEGPIEYKLHLLLRPRRKFRSISTGSYVAGSQRGSSTPDINSRDNSLTTIEVPAPSPPPASMHQTRQHRLEQLTTQLLWRLQQSSPHHSSSASNIIIPAFPEALLELQAPLQPSKLLHGLEESQGALYEIGVSDDGTLVGLAEDELEESLNNLRAMAACLGCTVEVSRKETVGECEWFEESKGGRSKRQVRRTGALFVAEAFIKPQLQATSPQILAQGVSGGDGDSSLAVESAKLNLDATEQLRITLAGPTMSGKSTLLGTLTTSTLDTGRGKSRLSMLKHRHEITSGITSSVTQELLGYRDLPGGDLELVNYATENVTSWIDIHRASSGSRLVFISDSAGHPRYRRTTVRSLVGWAPHWTLLCVPADNSDDTDRQATYAARNTLGSGVPEMDLSAAQLDLCLRLRLPLVVVITKLDLASRTGLKESLSRILDALKAAGRKPAIFRNTAGSVSEDHLGLIDSTLIDKAYGAVVPLLNDPVETVPIILTSAVDGTGISNLHALLHELPIPHVGPSSGLVSDTVFHIEDVYGKPADAASVIVSGLLRSGEIAIGDELALGPFSIHDQYEDSEDSDERPRGRSDANLPASRSFPGALKDLHLRSPRVQLPGQEWKRVKVTSVRNLRLPVHSLLADQVGTVAIAPCDEVNDGITSPSPLLRIRKGMVLTPIQPAATRTFVAEFDREDLESLAVGNHVVVYIASIRASAKVVSARAPNSPTNAGEDERIRSETQQEPFAFEDDDAADNASQDLASTSKVAGTITAERLQITFSFDSSREYVLMDDKVLVMPGGGPGLFGGQERGQKGMAALNGFVGRIVE